jgi:hypothetical protein
VIGVETAAADLTARAIAHVLESERDARSAVLACERACSERLETARQHARRIAERAQTRSVAMHGRAGTKLEHYAAEIMEQRVKAALDAVRLVSDPATLSAAIERLAAHLTSAASAPDAV